MYVRETTFKKKSNTQINQEEVSHKLLMFLAEHSNPKTVEHPNVVNSNNPFQLKRLHLVLIYKSSKSSELAITSIHI